MLTLETKPVFLIVLGFKSQLRFPPLQQDCPAQKSMSCSAGCMDTTIPWESHTEGCLARKNNPTDPGFAIRVTNTLEEQLIFGRNIRESAGSSVNTLRDRQEAGYRALLARRNPCANQGQWDYRGKQGLLARMEMGRAQPLVSTLAYTEQMPSRTQPYMTSYLGRLQDTVSLHNSSFLWSADKSPPLMT